MLYQLFVLLKRFSHKAILNQVIRLSVYIDEATFRVGFAVVCAVA